jgi:hypothetical protein
MNTPDERDECPPAVRSAEAAATAWAETVEHQQQAPPRHSDFYALAGEMVATLHALDDLTVVLAAQVGGYGQGRVLSDDTRTVDPAERLADAVTCLRGLRALPATPSHRTTTTGNPPPRPPPAATAAPTRAPRGPSRSP